MTTSDNIDQKPEPEPYLFHSHTTYMLPLAKKRLHSTPLQNLRRLPPSDNLEGREICPNLSCQQDTFAQGISSQNINLAKTPEECLEVCLNGGGPPGSNGEGVAEKLIANFFDFSRANGNTICTCSKKCTAAILSIPPESFPFPLFLVTPEGVACDDLDVTEFDPTAP